MITNDRSDDHLLEDTSSRILLEDTDQPFQKHTPIYAKPLPKKQLRSYKSTLVNISVLILLFAVVFLLQHIGGGSKHTSEPTQQSASEQVSTPENPPPPSNAASAPENKTAEQPAVVEMKNENKAGDQAIAPQPAEQALKQAQQAPSDTSSSAQPPAASSAPAVSSAAPATVASPASAPAAEAKLASPPEPAQTKTPAVAAQSAAKSETKTYYGETGIEDRKHSASLVDELDGGYHGRKSTAYYEPKTSYRAKETQSPAYSEPRTAEKRATTYRSDLDDEIVRQNYLKTNVVYTNPPTVDVVSYEAAPSPGVAVSTKQNPREIAAESDSRSDQVKTSRKPAWEATVGK